MSCYICDDWGATNSRSRGTCVECSRLACGRPPWRRDGFFHGDVCECGCGKFVCKKDALKHANGHNSQPLGCFPKMTFVQAVPALGATVALANDSAQVNSLGPTMPKALVNDFLNFVSPGWMNLQSAITSLSKVFFSTTGKDHFVTFEEPFFIQGD